MRVSLASAQAADDEGTDGVEGPHVRRKADDGEEGRREEQQGGQKPGRDA